MKVDFLIVGQGLAGSALAMALIRRGKSVLVVDRADANAATRVAAGLVTSLAGKGMNPAWRQEEYLPYAMAYYADLEKRGGRKLFYAQPVVRLFTDDKEKAKFGRKKANVVQWVLSEEATINSSQLKAEYGGFEMAQSGRLDTKAYLTTVRDLLDQVASYREANFHQQQVSFLGDGVEWKDVSAGAILLCQGYAGLAEGWFSNVPHRSAKGEMLTLEVDGLEQQRIINRNGWMVPLGQNRWRVGATYEWDDLASGPSKEGRLEVEKKVSNLVNSSFRVIEHEVGVRPIIHRSQPVVGWLKNNHSIGFFNGLGSKGVISAPSVGEHFAGVLCGEWELDPELSLERLTLS